MVGFRHQGQKNRLAKPRDSSYYLHKIYYKISTQNIYTRYLHKISIQHTRTTYLYKLRIQNFYTKHLHKTSIQNIYTTYLYNIYIQKYLQNIYTKYLYNIPVQHIYTKYLYKTSIQNIYTKYQLEFPQRVTCTVPGTNTFNIREIISECPWSKPHRFYQYNFSGERGQTPRGCCAAQSPQRVHVASEHFPGYLQHTVRHTWYIQATVLMHNNKQQQLSQAGTNGNRFPRTASHHGRDI